MIYLRVFLIFTLGEYWKKDLFFTLFTWGEYVNIGGFLCLPFVFFDPAEAFKVSSIPFFVNITMVPY